MEKKYHVFISGSFISGAQVNIGLFDQEEGYLEDDYKDVYGYIYVESILATSKSEALDSVSKKHGFPIHILEVLDIDHK